MIGMWISGLLFGIAIALWCAQRFEWMQIIGRKDMKDDGFQEMCRRMSMAGGPQAAKWAQAYALLEVAHKLSALSSLNYISGAGNTSSGGAASGGRTG